MEITRILYAVIGITQGIIGVLSGLLALLLGLGVVEIQTVLTLPPEFLSLYLLVIGLFSAFSILNALFLIRRWRS
jgi:hypothetical protein